MNSTNHQIALYGNLIMAHVSTHDIAKVLFRVLAVAALVGVIVSNR